MARKVTFKAGMPGGATRDITVEIHELDAAPWGADADLRVVGTDVQRLDGPLKATGRAKYTYDVNRPNMAFCGLRRCHHAHAIVASIDVGPAKKVAGVLDVDVLVPKGGRVTFSGKGVAAVCAETEEALRDGLAAVHVEYDVQPNAVTTEDGMVKDAPRVDPRRDNTVVPERGGVQQRGNTATAFAGAKAKVSAEFRTQVQTHSALETHGCVVEPNGDGSFTVWASTQGTGSVRGGMARALGVPPGKVRVITEHMGGGFGAKFGVDAWDQATARFAKKLGRPMKGMLDRREEHLVAGNRPDSIQRIEMAADENGRITGLRGEVLGTPGNGARGANAANSSIYRIPNVRVQQTSVSTFTGSGRAFRAPGHPQGVFALEGLMDMLADELRLDPLEFRLRNDEHPVRQAQWRIGAERIEWAARRKRPGGDGALRRGVGCAASTWRQAGRGNWVVNLEVSREGEVVVSNATQDIGTGTRTLVAIMVAEELGISPHDVTSRIGDTIHPAGPASGGSTTAPSIAPAAREAGLRAREGLAAALAEDWGVPPERVTFDGGRFGGPGGRQAGFKDAAKLLGPGGLTVSGRRRPNYEGFHGETAGCQFAEVEVDTETGVVRVVKVVAVHDAGRIVNTLAARSQVVGGVIQGIGYALLEDRRMDRNLGDMVNPTLDTYRILGIADCPEIDVVLTSLDSGFNNAGMMGLGEPATVPTAGAVANAVSHAIGRRMTELPITPQRVLAALGRDR